MITKDSCDPRRYLSMETDVTQLDTYVCVHFEESGFHIKTSWLECIDLNVIIRSIKLKLNVDTFPWLQNILTIYEQLHLFTLMKRRCGDSKNEIKTRWGDSKNEIGFDAHHVYEQNEIKTRPIMVEKRQNLRNEIKTRWGDSVNLLYLGPQNK